MGQSKFNVYLDDLRTAPVGFLRVRTSHECIALFKRLGKDQIGVVSLDHDLGTCHECGGFQLDDRGLPKSCVHYGTGYDVVCWMEANDFWPETKPLVHSSDPCGADKMRKAINRAYGAG